MARVYDECVEFLTAYIYDVAISSACTVGREKFAVEVISQLRPTAKI